MGYFGATSYVIGNIIGSGIFITPASILRSTESPGLSLLVWICCASIAFLGGFYAQTPQTVFVLQDLLFTLNWALRFRTVDAILAIFGEFSIYV